MQQFANQLIRQHGIYESFYIANLGVLEQKISEWKTHLPNVRPFYAIKCNPNHEMIKTLIDHDIGFDCASKNEIKTALDLGCRPNHILFMHPFKTREDIEYAVSRDIKYTTYDSFSEMDKLKTYGPSLQCLMRLKVNNPSARVQLGLKYGIDEYEFKEFVNYAKELNLNLVGVCYHVGSASQDPNVFKEGMRYAANVFDFAKQKGFNMSVLDIGGGFTSENFVETAKVIKNEIVNNSFDDPNINIFAEPGRYFASDVFTFFSPVIGVKHKTIPEYYIRDGLYGSFNCMVYDGQSPKLGYLRHPMLDPLTHNKNKESTLFGCTCDSLDSIGKFGLPHLRVHDFVVCDNFGAYTISGAKDFNGIPMSQPKIFYTKQKFE